jgi:hypothetical protein
MPILGRSTLGREVRSARINSELLEAMKAIGLSARKAAQFPQIKVVGQGSPSVLMEMI